MAAAPLLSRSLVALCAVIGVLESVSLPVPAPRCIRYSFTIPSASGPQSLTSFVLRVYGLAELDAQVPAPSWDGGSVDQVDNYARASEGDFEGAIKNGMDQYAVYFNGRAHSSANGSAGYTTLIGWWPIASYVSLQLVYGETYMTIPSSSLGTLMSTGSASAPNPFIKGHPTAVAYASQARCIAASAGGETRLDSPDTSQEFGVRTAALPSPSPASASCMDGNTFLYRMSQDFTLLSRADAPTGECSAGYLFAPAEGVTSYYSSLGLQNYVNVYNFSWGIIRMKVPVVFNSAADETYRGSWSDANPGGYEVNYLSVSSNVAAGVPDPNLPFTVNALMLRAGGMMTPEGLSYVLFAPAEVVRSVAVSNSTAPPKISLPRLGIMAYVLAAPSYAFMFRYKEPSASWSGSPGNVPCMAQFTEMNASIANCTTLGQWAPQITRTDGVTSLQDLADSVQ